MARYRVVFMGSPEFALPTLRHLLETEEVVCVVTQPDRRKGRGQTMTPPPVKVEAERAGVPVLQPPRLREPEAVAEVAACRPDAVVVVAYGQILPQALLDVPPLGCLNVHASLLPKYRGAAPIQWAIIRGEMVTGVTIMQMDAGLDTGDILLQQAVAIGNEETAPELLQRLSEIGARLLGESLKRARENTLFRMPQNGEAASLAPRLTKAGGAIRWSLSARQVHNLVRGAQPWPGAFTFLRGRALKVHRAQVAQGEATSPGEVLGVGPEGLLVSAGEGRVVLREIQAEGGRRLPASEFVLGHPVPVGTVLGTVGLKR
jgi:methionyl-tRNA formyltransferase